MRHVKGPDFPTGAFIYGSAGIREAYRTGRGRVVIRARATIESSKGGKDAIIVTEIPYQVNKTKLIEKIVELVRDKKVTGISDIRDESDREGMRLVIELKRDAVAKVVLNQLYKHTQMQSHLRRDHAGAGEGPAPRADAQAGDGAVHPPPPGGDRAPHALRPGQGRGPRAHPGRPQDRPGPHRRGHQRSSAPAPRRTSPRKA
jgi:hypothetical protein